MLLGSDPAKILIFFSLVSVTGAAIAHVLDLTDERLDRWTDPTTLSAAFLFDSCIPLWQLFLVRPYKRTSVSSLTAAFLLPRSTQEAKWHYNPQIPLWQLQSCCLDQLNKRNDIAIHKFVVALANILGIIPAHQTLERTQWFQQEENHLHQL